MKVSVIIPAAGRSSRVKKYDNKLLAHINEKPVLITTIHAFYKLNQINEIILAVSDEYKEAYRDLLKKHNLTGKIRFAKGGSTRTESVVNSFKEVSPDTDILLIHDGARPYVTERIIIDCIKGAAKHGCCLVAVKSKDTVKTSGDNGFVSDTLDRENIFLVHTPQGFRYDIAIKMYEYAKKNNISLTDDSAIAEAMGYKVYIAESDYSNIKITTDSDLTSQL